MPPESQGVLIGQLRELRGLGWSFVAIYTKDEPPQLDGILGARVRGEVSDTLHLRAEDEAYASRIRCDERNPEILWRFAGTLAEAIAGLLALAEPDESGSVTRSRRMPSDLWLPPGVDRCST
jgi:hypothetical protein